jgi:branched-chain amino acid transport system permease protein
MRGAAGLLALLLLLAGCAADLDPEQARICALLPGAVEPEGAAIEILRQAPGAGDLQVRVAYRAARADGSRRSGEIGCGFAGEGLAGGRLDLVAVESDGRRLGDIQLHILKRWYLGAEGVAAEAARDLPQAPPLVAVPLPHEIAYALQLLVNAAPLAGLDALLALAYALVYGLVGRILFGLGEVAVVGGFGTVLGLGLAVTLGLTAPAAALPIGLAAAVLVSTLGGVALAGMLGRLLALRRGLGLVVASIGLAVAIPEALRLAQGSGDLWTQTFFRAPVTLVAAPGFPVTATAMQAVVVLLSLAALTAMGIGLRRSGAGRAWRAVAEDAGTAELLGVDRGRVMLKTFAVSGALAGLAGFLLVVHYGGIGFSAGLLLGLKALLAAVVGGVGSLAGAALAGALVGVLETLWSGYFPLAYKDVAVLGALTFLLVLRPGGLLGWADAGPRQV